MTMKRPYHIFESDLKDKCVNEWAKEKIEEQALKHKMEFVLEARQLSPMGGVGYAITTIDSLDKDYIGYMGFTSYGDICRSIKREELLEEYGIKTNFRSEDGMIVGIIYSKPSCGLRDFRDLDLLCKIIELEEKNE